MIAMAKKPSALPRPFLSLRRLLRRSISGRQWHHYRRATSSSATGIIWAAPAQDKLRDQTVLVDVEGWLLRLPLSTFPYFMIIAVEAGSFLRGLLLLLAYPVPPGPRRPRPASRGHGHGVPLRAEGERGGQGLQGGAAQVLPGGRDRGRLEAFEKAVTVVAVAAALPRAMVEGFLKEYVTLSY